MTQWIAVAALATMVVMFALGLARGGEWKALFVTAVALAIAAIPEALPTVVQVILSLGAVGLARAAVASAQAAHIRVRMVTGDDVLTGAAIAKKLGIPGEAILGADFAALPEPERLERIDKIGVVGRVAPEHKVLLADTLKKRAMSSP